MTDDATTRALPRSIRALLKERPAIAREMQTLTAEEDQDREAAREADSTRRKLLVGAAVLYRALERQGLIPWLRRVLAAGLTRAYDRRMFRLADEGPLIPEEDWPGWPDNRLVEETLPEAPPKRLSPGRRRARLAYLKKRLATIDSKLDDLTKTYTPHRDRKIRQREILVGAVVLALSFRSHCVTRWLRILLDQRYTDVRDRKLFLLEEDGPLVCAEERAGLGLDGRQAATMSVSDEQPGASGHPGTVRAREPDRAVDGAVTPDVPDPMPGWQPHRLAAASTSRSGVRTGRSTWGARLTGRAAVAALPEDLEGRQIRVTDSNLNTWTTTITDVVSRDEGRVIVCNSGRPGTDDAGAGPSEEPGSSSS